MALVLGLASMYAAQQPAVAQAPPPQPGDTQLNSAVKSTMTCGEITALLRSEDRRTGGLAILWLDGFYSGHSGLAELLPAG
jgi:hypothetical protein